MRVKKFGNKNNEVIIFIHGYGISWRMWKPKIDAYSKDYFIVVPALAGGFV